MFLFPEKLLNQSIEFQFFVNFLNLVLLRINVKVYPFHIYIQGEDNPVLMFQVQL